jgi:hypothetical protein
VWLDGVSVDVGLGAGADVPHAPVDAAVRGVDDATELAVLTGDLTASNEKGNGTITLDEIGNQI